MKQFNKWNGSKRGRFETPEGYAGAEAGWRACCEWVERMYQEKSAFWVRTQVQEELKDE